MARRLACLAIPEFPMQVFLFEHPEWSEEAVVLLDRDEANGRILATNNHAASLGLGRGMLYGPCLGIHRGLKAGVVDSGQLEDWSDRLEEILLRFSPSVERAGFRDGLWWLDAAGLSGIFPSVRPWLKGLLEEVGRTGLHGCAASGAGRFSTWAATLAGKPGEVRIFAEPHGEEAWFAGVPLSLFSMKKDTRTLVERLKISTVGDLLKIPLPDIRRRLDRDTADLVERFRRDARLPLQSISPPEPREWRFPLEDPVSTAGPLCYVADRLIGRCREHARREGRQVRSMRFILEGRESSRDIVVRPARPTRDEGTLTALFASRLEYVNLEDPVHGVRCIGSFSDALTPQGTLFGEEARRREEDARKALAAIQAERGDDAVQYAKVKEDPLPLRRYELRDWKGFGRKAAGAPPKALPAPLGTGVPAIPSREYPGGSPAGEALLVRRISLSPGPAHGGLRILSRVAYSGGWWDRPYEYELAWAESGGRTCWLSAESGRRPWTLVGWLD